MSGLELAVTLTYASLTAIFPAIPKSVLPRLDSKALITYRSFNFALAELQGIVIFLVKNQAGWGWASLTFLISMVATTALTLAFYIFLTDPAETA